MRIQACRVLLGALLLLCTAAPAAASGPPVSPELHRPRAGRRLRPPKHGGLVRKVPTERVRGVVGFVIGHSFAHDHQHTVLGIDVSVDPGWTPAFEFSARAVVLLGEEAVFLSRLEPVNFTSMLSLEARYRLGRAWPVSPLVGLGVSSEPGIAVGGVGRLGLRIPLTKRFAIDLEAHANIHLTGVPGHADFGGSAVGRISF